MKKALFQAPKTAPQRAVWLAIAGMLLLSVLFSAKVVTYDISNALDNAYETLSNPR